MEAVWNENISTKSKVIAFEGQVIIRSKIIIQVTMLQQVNTVTYLGYINHVKRTNLKDKYIFTDIGNSERSYETRFSPKVIPIGTI
jgi:hypothetical protein